MKNRFKLAVFLSSSIICALIVYSFPQFSFSNNKKIKILCLDGGGIRGVASLELLSKIQKETSIRIYQNFDFFSGTSTGAIIAVCLALGREVEEILEDYEELSQEVFSEKHLGIFHHKYKHKRLKEILVRILNSVGVSEDATLGDLPKKVVIPSVVLKDPETESFSLYFFENITPSGKKEKIVDAILAATAAPTYFPSYHGKIDGGIGMNDPSLIALAYAFQTSGKLEDIILFSVGTGYVKDGIKGNEHWGALNWFFDVFGRTKTSTPLLSMMFDINDLIPSQICSRILGDSYKRFNFPLNSTYPLDDFKEIVKLIHYTDQIVQIEGDKWEDVCSWIIENIKTNQQKETALYTNKLKKIVAVK